MLWSRLIANYITFAVGEVLLLILTICSLAAIFPRVSNNTPFTFDVIFSFHYLAGPGTMYQHLQISCICIAQKHNRITLLLSFAHL